MSRQVTVSTLITDQFSLLSGFNKMLNEPVINFTTTAYVNGAVSPATVTLTEIAVSLGEWVVSWTPDTVGFWVIEVVHTGYAQRTKLEYDVVPAALTGANRPPVSGT